MALTFDEGYYNASASPVPRPEGYARYSRDQWAGDYTFGGFAQRTIDEAARRGQSLAQRGVLVAGCAYGFMVEELRAQGVPTWGVDVSDYALGQAPAAIAPFLAQADVRVPNGLEAARTLAGLKGKQTFDLVIDEDLLVCLTDQEAVAACQEMRRVGTRVVHRLSVHPLPGYNTKPLAEWKALCDPDGADWWFEYTTWQAG